MKNKIVLLLGRLSAGLVERDETIKVALLALLAGENILLIGPPGTGKSMISRRMKDALLDDSGKDYFEYLLTKFSTPEEVFGPLSISALKQDRFERKTDGYLPSVKIGFLDEIFKASSSILNALLTIINERKYHNGTEMQAVPLQSLIAASNELPGDQDELSALYDRFLFRIYVGYVSEESRSKLFAVASGGSNYAVNDDQKLTVEDLEQIRDAANRVELPQGVLEAVQNIWLQHQKAFAEDRRESLSDRRLIKAIRLMKVAAASLGRKEVNYSDLSFLRHCLWNHPDNRDAVGKIVMSVAQEYARKTVKY